MDSSSHFPLELSDTSVDEGQKNPNSSPPQLMGTDGSEQMYGDGCVFKDADSSSVPAMCVAASPLPSMCLNLRLPARSLTGPFSGRSNQGGSRRVSADVYF